MLGRGFSHGVRATLRNLNTMVGLKPAESPDDFSSPLPTPKLSQLTNTRRKRWKPFLRNFCFPLCAVLTPAAVLPAHCPSLLTTPGASAPTCLSLWLLYKV